MEKNKNEQGFTLPDSASAKRAALISNGIVDSMKKDPRTRALWSSSEQAMDLAAELDNGSQKDRKIGRRYILPAIASTIATVACAIVFPPLLALSVPSLFITGGLSIAYMTSSEEKKEQSIACKAIAKMSPDEKKEKRSALLLKIIDNDIENMALRSGITNEEGFVGHIKIDNAQIQHQYNLDNKSFLSDKFLNIVDNLVGVAVNEGREKLNQKAESIITSNIGKYNNNSVLKTNNLTEKPQPNNKWAQKVAHSQQVNTTETARY